MNRVIVTGMGVVTPLGSDLDSTWKSASQCSVGTVPKLKPSAPLGQSQRANVELRRDCPQSRAEALTKLAVGEALGSAELDRREVACTFSASKPLFDGSTWQEPGVVNSFVCRQFGLSGEARNVVAACATGAYSIAMAASWIEQGLCEVAVAGSVEPAPHPLIEAGFRRMGVISRETVMRPFDKRRSGFVFGEGAGAVVLESETHAARRGAKPLARLSGWGLGADAHGPVSFNSKGARIAAVIEKALAKAGLPPHAIGHLNAHGTATALNDSLETQALHAAFGPHAPRLAIAATKSATGHLLGAAGSVEFILTVLALRDQKVPPTRHWEEADPACDLDYVTEPEPRPWLMDHAMSISFGFGGPIGALLVSRC